MESIELPVDATVSPVETANITLFPHQINALHMMPKMEQEGNGGVLAFEPGLGKTMTIVAHLKHMKSEAMNKGEKPGCDLIVVPVAVLTHWNIEIRNLYSDKEGEPRVLIYHGSKRNPNDISKEWDYIITTHDVLKSKKNGKYEINKKFTRIVIDEAHKIKSASQKNSSAVARAALDFKLKSNYRWCVTGTPFNNSLMDLASLAMFIGTKGYTNSRDWKDGAIDVNAWIEKYVIIHRKDGIMKKPNHHDILISPTNDEAKISESLREITGKHYEMWKNADKKDKIKHQGTLLGLITKMRQVSDSYYIIGERYSNMNANTIYKHNTKVKKTIDIVNEKLYSDRCDPCKGIVIFSQFKHYLLLLKKVIENKLPNTDIYLYTGSVTKVNRDNIIEEFTTSLRPRVLLISLFAGGVGLNLKPCSTILLSEPWYNPFIEQQAEDRVHRLGQKHTVNVYRMTMESSVEKWIQGIKMSKLKKADEVGLLDGIPKKGMGGITSTFKMEDLDKLFNDFVGMKVNGKLVKPAKSKTNEGVKKKTKIQHPDMTNDKFTLMMNSIFGLNNWDIANNNHNNKEYVGGACLLTKMNMKDFMEFAEVNEMTYIKKIPKKLRDDAKIDVNMRILPGRKIQVWFDINHNMSKGTMESKLKNNTWKDVNTYLKNWNG